MIPNIQNKLNKLKTLILNVRGASIPVDVRILPPAKKIIC
jgi:hypothetical protein